ncbi:MAG: hypothetical protein PHH59_06650 [Methylovulum sp.]|nr:hypothetical protein [Methylovulum sp.]MDD2723685.1 hypothetical protein [Methylovulum sp.]MDD5123341.1 hypothetical protein [Methylovulum sp.]
MLENMQDGIEYIYLRGNHEQTLLDFLQEVSVGLGLLMADRQL